MSQLAENPTGEDLFAAAEAKNASIVRTLGAAIGRSSASIAVAVLMIVAVLALAFLVPLTPGFDPYHQSLSASLESVLTPGHLLGTDQLGRDILSRLAIATQVSLSVALGAVAISAVLGAVIGLVAGYVRGWVDTVLMGLGDVQLAVPVMLLLIVIVATAGSSPVLLTVVLGLMSWMAYGRVVRSIVVSLREQEFVAAAISAGASAGWIIRKHLLRNVLPQVLILAAFQIGVVITIESSLSFIGLGIQPPTPSLGLMISDGQGYLQSDPALVIVPAVAVFFLIAGAQFLSQDIGARRTRR